MTVEQLIGVLQKLPMDAEVALLAASGFARPPVVEKVKPYAGWDGGDTRNRFMWGGLDNPHSAYLIRPAQDVIL